MFIVFIAMEQLMHECFAHFWAEVETFLFSVWSVAVAVADYIKQVPFASLKIYVGLVVLLYPYLSFPRRRCRSVVRE
jgi:hypothetical protein